MSSKSKKSRGPLRFEYVRADQLKDNPLNWREHPPEQIAVLRDAITQYGFAGALLYNEKTGHLIDGHARKEMARPDELLPVVIGSWTLEQEKGLLATYDPIGAMATANKEAFKTLLEQTEFRTDALQGLVDNMAELNAIVDEEVQPPAEPDIDLTPPKKPKTRKGQVMKLGPHRVLCGDACNPDDVDKLMAQASGAHVDLVVTSPPYNIDMTYDAAPDKRTREDYLKFISTVGDICMSIMDTGRFLVWNIGVTPKTYPCAQVVELEKCGFTFQRQIIWLKDGVPYPTHYNTVNAAEARHYTPNNVHEAIYLMTKGDTPMYGDPIEVEMALRDDVWRISQQRATVDLETVDVAGSGLTPGGVDSHLTKEHPAPFPVELPRLTMGALTAKGELVYDPFLGAGTTLIAAEMMGRRCFGMEIDPGYCDIIRKRYNAWKQTQKGRK